MKTKALLFLVLAGAAAGARAGSIQDTLADFHATPPSASVQFQPVQFSAPSFQTQQSPTTIFTNPATDPIQSRVMENDPTIHPDFGLEQAANQFDQQRISSDPDSLTNNQSRTNERFSNMRMEFTDPEFKHLDFNVQQPNADELFNSDRVR